METQHGTISLLETEAVIRIFERGELAHLGCYANKEVYIVPIAYAGQKF